MKDEPQQKQLTTVLTDSPVISISTPPHNNNNNSTNNSNTPNNTSAANNVSSNNNNSSYYDTHNVFPTSVNNNNNQDTILYDSITSISQAQNTLYAPSIGTSIGKLWSLIRMVFEVVNEFKRGVEFVTISVGFI